MQCANLHLDLDGMTAIPLVGQLTIGMYNKSLPEVNRSIKHSIHHVFYVLFFAQIKQISFQYGRHSSQLCFLKQYLEKHTSLVYIVKFSDDVYNIFLHGLIKVCCKKLSTIFTEIKPKLEYHKLLNYIFKRLVHQILT